MTEQELRLECLRMAIANDFTSSEDEVEAAEDYYAFLMGKTDDAEIVCAAKKFAEKVKG